MKCSPGSRWQRNTSVLFWTPWLLLGPVLGIHGSAGTIAFRAVLVVVIAAAAVVIGLTGGPPWRSATPYAALAVLFAATASGSIRGGSTWLPTWILVANALAAALTRRWLVVAIPVTVAASAWAAWAVEPHRGTRMWTEAFVVLLAGLANAAFTALLDALAELRATRQDLARLAVAEERERFSRDLHDLLGHTLSVMVVKAAAVRRLAVRDPEAAAAHAADIEDIGRRALLDVRQAVDAMRAPSLDDELDGSTTALRAAGVDVILERHGPPPAGRADEVLAWVVREATTNVLRHAHARSCRIELDGDATASALVVEDDGDGSSPTGVAARRGGLDGLRDRVVAAGGELSWTSHDDGFRLAATVPGDPR